MIYCSEKFLFCQIRATICHYLAAAEVPGPEHRAVSVCASCTDSSKITRMTFHMSLRTVSADRGLSKVHYTNDLYTHSAISVFIFPTSNSLVTHINTSMTSCISKPKPESNLKNQETSLERRKKKKEHSEGLQRTEIYSL